MSDGQNPPQAEGPKEVDPAVIQRIAQEAIKAEVEKVQKGAAESTQRALDEQQKRIIRALGGEDDKSRSDELAALLLTNPASVLGDVAAMTRRETLAEIEKREKEKEAAAAAEREAQANESRAVGEFFTKRTDIRDSKEARDILEAQYLATDATLPPAERLALAEKKYDAFLEKIDGKTPEQRREALAAVSATSSAAAQPPARKSAEELRKEDFAARKEREMKLRRGNVSQIRFS